MKLHVATTNAGKLRDFQHAAEQAERVDVTLEVLPDLDHLAAPEEDGDTFAANARLKAVYYSLHAPGVWVLADDSGLEVDALQGRPGVRSARFAADLGALDPERGTDASNNEALLLAMLEQTDRTARYRCALALALDGQVHHTEEGAIEGEILSEPEGTGGFGYDPLFFVPELNCTLAQTSLADRLRLGHRGKALRALFLHLADQKDPEDIAPSS